MMLKIVELMLVLMIFVGCGVEVAEEDDEGGSTIEVIAFEGTIPNAKDSISYFVTARSVSVTPMGDSIIHEKTTISEGGVFVFDSLPLGVYQISSLEEEEGFSRQYHLENDSVANIELRSKTVLKGRVFTESSDSEVQLSVFIPGTEIIGSVDSEGFYILNHVPQDSLILTITNGIDINYLAISILETEGDTVFLRDVRMVSDTGVVAKNYSPYPTSEDVTYSVVPQFYSEETKPSWYIGKEFDSVDYFISTEESKELYQPEPKEILYVGRFDKDDEIMIERLVVQGYTLHYKSNEDVVEEDALGIDMIYTSYSLNSVQIDTLFKNVTIPIIVNESNYAKKIGMISNGGAMSLNQLILKEEVILTEGLPDTLDVTDTKATMEYGIIGEGAIQIAHVPDFKNRSLFFVYEKGAEMLGGVAPEKRIGFFVSSGTAQKMNDQGWVLFDRVIRYALGE